MRVHDVEVYNGIFAHPWWRRIPILGLFKSTSFDRHEIQISKVEQLLREIEDHVRSVSEKATPGEKT